MELALISLNVIQLYFNFDVYVYLINPWNRIQNFKKGKLVIIVIILKRTDFVELKVINFSLASKLTLGERKTCKDVS